MFMSFLNILESDLRLSLVVITSFKSFDKVLGRLLKPLLLQSIRLFRDKRSIIFMLLCCRREGTQEAGDLTHSISLYHADR